jgi:hypothetical protein
MDGSSFSRQHDVRYVTSNKTHLTVSLLDNGADMKGNSLLYSRGLILSLCIACDPMIAKVVAQYDRPDKGLSRLRGNMQLLPNGNVFIGWGKGGYHSEFTKDGKLVMEAAFLSERLSSYRAYKFDFIGKPTKPPALKAFSYGEIPSHCVVVCYVSWNGATEVVLWRFYGRTGRDATEVTLGTAPKDGFETMFMADKYFPFVTAEAFDNKGQSLGRSNLEETSIPLHWTSHDSVVVSNHVRVILGDKEYTVKFSHLVLLFVVIFSCRIIYLRVKRRPGRRPNKIK